MFYWDLLRHLAGAYTRLTGCDPTASLTVEVLV